MKKGDLNSYTCVECRETIITVDLEAGTTPMFLACRVSERCRGIMESNGYPAGLKGTPTHEWYKPGWRELQMMSLEMKVHVRKGGLDIRPVTP